MKRGKKYYISHSAGSPTFYSIKNISDDTNNYIGDYSVNTFTQNA